MKRNIRHNWIQKWVVAGIVSATLLSSMTACGSAATPVDPTKEFNSQTSYTQTSSMPSQNTNLIEAKDAETGDKKVVSDVVFGLGTIKVDQNEDTIFTQTMEENQQKLKTWQAKTADENGYKELELKTALGATIYTHKETPNKVMFFSGSEVIELENVNAWASNCGLYDVDSLYDLTGRGPGSLKTQDGVSIQDAGMTMLSTWDGDNEFGMVMVDGMPQAIAPGSSLESFGSGDNLKLGALSGIETLAQAKELFNQGGGKAVTIDNVKYQMIKSGGGVNVAFDGRSKFVIMIDKMIAPSDDAMQLDANGYLSMVNKEFGNELKDNGVEGKFVYLQVEIDNAQWIWDVAEKKLIEVDPMTVDGDDGCLQISLRSLEQATGVKGFVSSDGSVLNIVLNPEYNVMQTGSELGYVQGGAAMVQRQDMKEYQEKFEIVVGLEQAAEAQAEAQQKALQAQKEAAAKAEAQQKAAAEKKAAEEAAAQQQQPSGGGGSQTQQPSGGGKTQTGGKQEPAGGCPNSELQGAKWDSSVGAWHGTIDGISVWVAPDGSFSMG